MYEMALIFADLFQEITFCYVDQGRSEALHWKSVMKIVGSCAIAVFPARESLDKRCDDSVLQY